MKDRQFNHIFNECLDRLLRGESIEQCLEQYPAQAEELRSLLQTAAGVKNAACIEPGVKFMTQARAQFRAALQVAAEKKSRPAFQWLPNWSVALAGVLIVLVASAGTMVAAQTSMPDQPLYAVKLATEQARIKLTLSDIAKAELYARLADRRVAEISYLADKGKNGQMERISEKFDNYVALIAILVSRGKDPEAEMKLMAPAAQPPDAGATPGVNTATPSLSAARAADESTGTDSKKARLKELVARLAEEHPRALREALEKAPDKVKAALQRAIEESEEDYQQALDALNAPEN